MPQPAALSPDLVVDGSAVLAGLGLPAGFPAGESHLDHDLRAAEESSQGKEHLPSFIQAVGIDQSPELALSPSGKAEEALAMLRQERGGDDGGMVTVGDSQVRGRQQPAEV